MDNRPIIDIQRGTRSHHIRITEATDNKGQGVIFTDSLSFMMVTSGNNHSKNPKTRKIRQLMDERKRNVTVCWVPGHAEITGNEEANEAAKRVLEEAISNDKKYPPESGQPTKKVE
jgi:ribonuclease HI